jgi:hypothetical protein
MGVSQFVYVSNLPYEAGESIIVEAFSKEGIDVVSDSTKHINDAAQSSPGSVHATF